MVSEKIGNNRALTPEGFLLCTDVPIARTGTQIYRAGEIPVPDKGGVIRVERSEDEVFNPESLASFNGKPVVDEHPFDQMEEEGFDITPDNHQQYAVGVTLNPRRGTGELANCIVADLMITDAATIKLVDGGKREISCGYSCDYIVVEPGLARQSKIVGNHTALVQSGRCGTRCSIRDEDKDMRVRDDATGKSRFDKMMTNLRNAIRTGDKATAKSTYDELLETGSEGSDPMNAGGAASEHHVHVHLGSEKDDSEIPADGKAVAADPAAGGGDVASQIAALAKMVQALVAKVDAMAGDDTEEEPADEEGEDDVGDDDEDEDGITGDSVETGEGGSEGDDGDPVIKPGDLSKMGTEKVLAKTGDRKGKGRDSVRVRDSAHLATRFQDVIAAAEILSPGVRAPTFDAAARAPVTLDSICQLRRRALARAWSGTRNRDHIAPVVAGRDLKKLPCEAVRSMFDASVALVKHANNSEQRGEGRVRDSRRHESTVKTPTIAELNAKNRARYHQPVK